MTLFEIKEGITMAFAALKANKMRSFLTVLGVLVGVTAVIGMVSIIQGLNNSMARQIESLGSDTIYVTRFRIGVQLGRRSEEERNRKPITFEDAMAVCFKNGLSDQMNEIKLHLGHIYLLVHGLMRAHEYLNEVLDWSDKYQKYPTKFKKERSSSKIFRS